MLILFSILFFRSKIFIATNVDGWGENYRLSLFFFVRPSPHFEI